MSDTGHYIYVFPSVIEDGRNWHWKRVTEEGAQVDGSGPQRNGLPTKAEARAAAEAVYPDDPVRD